MITLETPEQFEEPKDTAAYDKYVEQKVERLDKIAADHGFHSTWSHLDVVDFNSVAIRGTALVLKYVHPLTSARTCNLPDSPTWLDLWKAADQLIPKENWGHRFIEWFDVVDDHTLELRTGS